MGQGRVYLINVLMNVDMNVDYEHSTSALRRCYFLPAASSVWGSDWEAIGDWRLKVPGYLLVELEFDHHLQKVVYCVLPLRRRVSYIMSGVSRSWTICTLTARVQEEEFRKECSAVASDLVSSCRHEAP